MTNNTSEKGIKVDIIKKFRFRGISEIDLSSKIPNLEIPEMDSS